MWDEGLFGRFGELLRGLAELLLCFSGFLLGKLAFPFELLLSFPSFQLALGLVPAPIEEVLLLPGWKVHPAFRIRLQLVEGILRPSRLLLSILELLHQLGAFLLCLPQLHENSCNVRHWSRLCWFVTVLRINRPYSNGLDGLGFRV